MLATWCAYLAFALLTGWEDYGLTTRGEDWQRWVVGRIGTVTGWLFRWVVWLMAMVPSACCPDH
jgi:hypothetical protein